MRRFGIDDVEIVFTMLRYNFGIITASSWTWPFRQASTFNGSGLTSEKFMTNPENEPVLTYQKGSIERIALEKAMSEIAGTTTDVPLVIGNEKILENLDKKQVMSGTIIILSFLKLGFSNRTSYCCAMKHRSISAFRSSKVIARFAHATAEQIKEAIQMGLSAKRSWERNSYALCEFQHFVSQEHRERSTSNLFVLQRTSRCLLHAADLCAGKYRMRLNAATMLGQGKILCRLKLIQLVSWSLEGFVAAIAPFNFTAIGGNLATAPAMMGNTVLWKPSCAAILSNYFIYEALEEAGLPAGIISFLPSEGPVFGNAITSSSYLSAINFTGSVPTFKYLWKKVAENLDTYISFPKLIGECGGKNFHFIHPSADLDTVAPCTIRAAYEYQGQKCSACSRIYVPESLWSALQTKLQAIQKKSKLEISYIDYAKTGTDGAKIIFGGTYDDSKGYFIQPTLIKVDKWDSKLLKEEIFGPVLSAYVYKDSEALEIVKKLKDSTIFGLTGAVFSEDREFLYKSRDILRHAVGNMYLNDKSTGSVVGQQPFGGARMSGTNDKAGGPHYVLRWVSPLCIKETSVPQTEWRYPSMD
ncbi:Delta-1-pyrroline-5-carboxylate dehydrogenase, mitochondrial [Dirofilaria immitis]|nr:Delta-1-pyrroline-5-carboxylate dehydrogenase, mitochondrial [Dirofilaria immitis]